MLFNSYEFIFVFLPLVFGGFYFLLRIDRSLAWLWIGAASFCFYAWWNPRFVLLLLLSIGFNYGAAAVIRRTYGTRAARAAVIFAVAANLGLLGVFKYANFFISSINAAAGTDLAIASIVLPLGISFFTFTQIAFLVDVYRGVAREYSLVYYLTFVSYFPHVIAGPVLRHGQIVPQFDVVGSRPKSEDVAVGLTLFAIGLAKKVLVADKLGDIAAPVFDHAHQGIELTLSAAWTGALAYTFQLYFDFSGYSDMAIGLSRLFGVKLPANFDSPYKAHNIIEFWRRWHMSLSQFLRDYLYIPLGGNRRGKARRYLNLTITMLLGGLWHGANWTFVAWGGLHALFLVCNHGWHRLREVAGYPAGFGAVGKFMGTVVTFLAVVVSWVIFRAESLPAAMLILKGMVGEAGVGEPVGARALLMLAVAFVIVFWAPNSQEMLQKYQPVLDEVRQRSNFVSRNVAFGATAGIVTGALLFLSILFLGRPSAFLYYQF